MTEPRERVLAGDIGGTKSRIGLFEAGSDGVRVIEERRFANADFDGLDAIVARFFEGRAGTCGAACFGLAGPVTGRRVRITNLPWVVDADELQAATGVPSVVLINDLEATAWGVTAVGDDAVFTLNPGRPGARGNGAVIAAGTGLGEAGMYWDGRDLHPFGCEGGHAGFSPSDELGDRLLQFLRDRYGTVSWERVLSGPGLADLYRFMLSEAGQPEPGWFVEAERSGDPAPAVSAAGLAGECEVAALTLDVFARLYGEEAGNLALKLMATGGVWVGGGIAPKILPVLAGGAFLEGFLARGRMRPLLDSMPVRVVLDDRAALIGAARRAAIGAGGTPAPQRSGT
jgi:glucokinase